MTGAAVMQDQSDHDAVMTAPVTPPADAGRRPLEARADHGPPHGPTAEQVRKTAEELDNRRARNPFYHQRISEYLRFVVPEGESVLLIGCQDGSLLSSLRPSAGAGIDRQPEMIACARLRNPQYPYQAAPDYAIEQNGTFEYVVLNDVIGEVEDPFTFLERLRRLCTPTSRLVLVQHNRLWRANSGLRKATGSEPHASHTGKNAARRGACTLSQRASGRTKPRHNRLSARHLRMFLDAAGFEVVDLRSKLFCPKKLCGLGPIINGLCGLTPFVHDLANTQIIVARLAPQRRDPPPKSASIVLATRDERDNVEPMVRALPKVGTDTEILFVEGHSRDGTREEIQRVIEAYPEKNIRLIVQTEGGVGRAIRQGFTEAAGDVIIFVEADRTSPPRDALEAFDIIASGRADYVNGSRFVYPMEKGAMPLCNRIGNRLFAMWFTWFLKQRTSDVLCGLKAIDRRQFRRLLKNWGFLGLPDPFGDFELVFGAARLGLKMCEVPTRYTKRSYGRTKSRFFRHGWMLARMAMRAARVFKCR